MTDSSLIWATALKDILSRVKMIIALKQQHTWGDASAMTLKETVLDAETRSDYYWKWDNSEQFLFDKLGQDTVEEFISQGGALILTVGPGEYKDYEKIVITAHHNDYHTIVWLLLNLPGQTRSEL